MHPSYANTAYASIYFAVPQDIKNLFEISAEKYFSQQQMTVDVFNSKYAFEKENGSKENPAECFWRVSAYIASAESDDGFSLEIAIELAIKWFWMMWKKEFIPGGRIMVAAGNPAKVSFNNCTTSFPPEDSLESIYDAAAKMARCLSYGEGIGLDASKLRPENMKTNNAAKTTSGAISWMDLYDFTTGTVAQSGRRGALLLSLSITHPEVIKFIKVKSDLSKINNANISLQITDDFMQAVIDDKDWTFTWVNDNNETISFETHSAKNIMRMISEHSSVFAEPGLQFIDIARKFSNSDTLGKEYEVVSTNACSEQWLDPYSQCVLGHANWATLPLDFNEATQEAKNRGYYISWFLDNVVTKQIKDKRAPLPESEYKSIQLRRIGQGFTGLADYFSKLNIAYDSIQAQEIARELTKAMTSGAYKRSIESGETKGNFGAFDAEKIRNSQFIKNMIKDEVLPCDFSTLRNVCNTTLAPVGSGNLMVNGWANGVEPGIGYIYWRRTRSVTGNYQWYFFINPFVYELIKDEKICKDLKILEKQINDAIVGEERFELEDKAFQLLKQANIDLNIHKFSHLVDPLAKSDLMGAIQRYIDSAISVTFNMPESTTVEEIEQLYIRCWKNHLKGVAIYREDPKNREPIFIFNRPKSYNYNINKLEKQEALVKLNTKSKERIVGHRPLKLNGFTEAIQTEGHKFYFTYNLDENNNLYEVLAHTNSREPKVSTEAAQEILIKMLQEENIPQIFIDDQLNKSSHQSSAVKICRLISLALRHHILPSTILLALEKHDASMSSYLFHLKRGLSQFSPTYIESCPNCREETMIVEAGCKHCDNCGHSGC